MRAGGACFKFLAQTEAIHVQHYGRQRRSALKAQVMRNDLLFILLVTQFNWNFFSFFFFFKGWGDPGKEPYCTELKQNRDFNIGSAYRAKVYIIFFFQHVTENV